MFHCYRSDLPDHDSIELLSGDTSMVSLIKSRSNYSTVLTMGLPRIIEIGALSKRGSRNKFKKQRRPSLHNLRYLNDRTDSSGTFLDQITDLPFLTCSIDVPMVISVEDCASRNITVSYSQKDNLLSVGLPKRNETVIENSISQMKWMASKRGVSGTPNICDNLTADITAKCADIEVYRFRRAEEETQVTRCNVSVSFDTMAQSQPEQRHQLPRHSTSKIKELRNWWKTSVKILDCNCFKGPFQRNPNDNEDD